MYNVLIVDDEKIIREGVLELLSLEEKFELNLFTAPSAVSARTILEQRKIDIVLTDIQMPKMSGIELMDVILEQWPHCKVIFLTGYSDFDYVYKVHKHARYVLKAEDDEKIIEAVTEAIEEIENDFMIERIVASNTLLVERQKEQDRTRFLFDLFNGFVASTLIDQQFFDSLEIKLDINKEIYYLVIHHAYLLKDSYHDQLKVIEDMQLLVDKYFFASAAGISINYSKNFLVLLMQSIKPVTPAYMSMVQKGNGELFQKACMKNLGMSLSIAIGAVPLTITDIPTGFQTLKAALLMNSDENVSIMDGMPIGAAGETQYMAQQKNSIKSGMQLLDFYFENSNRESVIVLIEEALRLFDGNTDMQDLFAVEIYSNIAVKLIKYINQFNISITAFSRTDLTSLYNLQLHTNWKNAFSYLISVTGLLFDVKSALSEKQHDDVTGRIKTYIQDNLNGDTSLDSLADYVNLSPEHLSRLFKKSEGVTVLHYINDLKIIKAKKMISDNNLQIKEIAYDLGFSSSGYFGRFFKSKTGLSPQGYRDQVDT